MMDHLDAAYDYFATQWLMSPEEAKLRVDAVCQFIHGYTGKPVVPTPAPPPPRVRTRAAPTGVQPELAAALSTILETPTPAPRVRTRTF